ncbi:MAG: TRAP transporter small permease, partial [Proteobacteria bacterium]|nr:TRAP transporter small permease [Pseudomonadota bacterium]
MFFQRLAHLLKNLEDIFAWIAIAILVAITVAVCLEVLMRYVFNSPIYFVVELSEYGLLYITFLGAGWALRENGHVRVEIFLAALNKTWRHRMGILSSSFGIIVSFVLLYFGTSRTLDAYARGLFKATIVEFPTWIVLIVIPLGSFVLLGRFTQR